MHESLPLAVLASVLSLPDLAPAGEAKPKEVPAVLKVEMKSLSGEPKDFAAYHGKVLLIANVASECGFTPQYADLQKLHQTYAAQGLAVIGVPSNEFGGQEPGSSSEIATFCSKNYGVTFDLTEKVYVLGPGKVPLYAWLTSRDNNPTDPGEVKWNFEKFLIGRDGKLIARYRSKVKPTDPEVVKAIEAALAAK
jgi:glutathione peroxidase